MNRNHPRHHPLRYRTAPTVWCGVAALCSLLAVAFLLSGCATSQPADQNASTARSPMSDPVAADADQPLVIRIDASGGIAIGRRAYTLEELPEPLERVGRRTPERPVVIRADAEVKHEYPSQVLDLCRQAGLRSVRLAYLIDDPDRERLPAHLSR